jgi:uncharacterized small protein (DUF1192 family)
MQNYFGQYPVMQGGNQPISNNMMPNMAVPNVPRMEQGAPQNIFVPVANENVARNFPVAYGNTVIFKDENSPKIYIKAMGYSQLESPVFEKYAREDEKELISDTKNDKLNTLSLNDLESQISALKSEMEALKEKVFAVDKPRRSKREATEDDE